MTEPAASPVILLAFANKQGDYLPYLKNERDRLDTALQQLQDRDAIQVKPVWETSLEGLFTALNHYGDRLAIIHYAGHADSGALHLETATGTEIVAADALARRFAQLPALKLVFLNGCATKGHVAALLAAGVKAVIATRIAVNDAMASVFAAQFYEALANPSGTASIADAFETASAFAAGKDQSRSVNVYRGGFDTGLESDVETLNWGLFCRDDADPALAWRLPTAAPIDFKGLQERMLRGGINPADPDLALFFDLYKLKVGASATPVPASALENFTTTVTALATAADPADRRAAASVVRGDEAGAYDQLIAAAEAGAEKAAAEATAAAARFRQAAALAAPTSVTRALSAYGRAADLDPADFWTWIELARLHRTCGAPAESRRCADRARQIAQDDRERCVVEVELGDLATASGSLAEAQGRFIASHEIFERLAAADLPNSQRQCDLSVSHDRLGDIARARGDAAEARDRFTASLVIRERLAAAEPANKEWQRNLSVSHNKLGDLARASGDLAEARSRFAAGFIIRERLASTDPAKSERQRDLSISLEKLGDLARAEGDFIEARSRLTANLSIRKRLAAADPANTEWQRDLSISHNRLGDLARDDGDLIEARVCFSAGLDIAERLAAADPSNTQWQRDLSISHNKLGDLARDDGDLAEARSRMTASLNIRKRLAAIDTANTLWQRDLSISHEKLGDLAETEGDLASAVQHYEASLPIAEALAAQSPDNPGLQNDLAITRRRLAELEGGPAG